MFPRKFDSALRRDKVRPYMAIITKFDSLYDILSWWVFGVISSLGDAS